MNSSLSKISVANVDDKDENDTVVVSADMLGGTTKHLKKDNMWLKI